MKLSGSWNEVIFIPTFLFRTHFKNRFVLVFSSIRSLIEAIDAAHTGGSTGNSSNEG
ncbi:MAG TPA: hypothetical protein PLJ00_13985 [Chitinophagales bacterium]|nr:hypothetical protein [Chitinophagales bacterium]